MMMQCVFQEVEIEIYVLYNLDLCSKLLRTNSPLSFTLVSGLANVAAIYGIGQFLILALQIKDYENITTFRLTFGSESNAV
jgi:hypothetical protein